MLVFVIGCVVNGLGEVFVSDIGFVGVNCCFGLYINGEC